MSSQYSGLDWIEKPASSLSNSREGAMEGKRKSEMKKGNGGYEKLREQRVKENKERMHKIFQNIPGSSSRHVDSKKKNMKNSKDSADINVPGRDTRPCFIKLIVHNGNVSHSLTIPTDFVKQYLPKPMPTEAILKGPSGDIWKISMFHDGANMVMQQGWQQFYKDHSLGSQNELLLFKHNGNMSFDVQIFGKNGSEIDVPMTRKRKNSDTVEIKEEEEEED